MGKINIFNTTLNNMSSEIKDFDEQFYSVDVRPKYDMFAVGGSSKEIKLIDAETLKLTAKFEGVLMGHTNRIFAVKFDP
jgi:WD40 repeat protein